MLGVPAWSEGDAWFLNRSRDTALKIFMSAVIVVCPFLSYRADKITKFRRKFPYDDLNI